MKLFHGQKIVLFLSIFALAACASARPRSRVVRLSPLESVANNPETKAVDVPVVSPLYLQASSGSVAEIPAEKDDAAIYYFSLGQAYSLDNEVARAIEAYKATLFYDANSALVHTRLAAEYVKDGNLLDAKTHCLNAIALDAKYVDAYLLLAGIQVASKEYQQSLSTYRKALAEAPKNRDAILYYGVTLAEIGKVDAGIEQLEKLVKMKEVGESQIDQSVAQYYLARLFKQAGKNKEALQSLQAAIKARPNFGKAALLAAEIYLERKDRSHALSVLTEAFREAPQAELAERLANLHLDAEEFKEAILYLETLVEEDPSNENLRLKLALIYWQVKWLDKAQMALSKLQSRYPESNEIAYYLAELQLERLGAKDALPYFLKITPDYSKFDQVSLRIAGLFRDTEQLAEGENFLRNALGKRPDIVALYPVLAAFFEDQNKLDKAQATLEAGLQRFPTDEGILYYMGFVLDRQGQRNEAMQAMLKLLETNPKNANALNFLGYSYLEAGQDLASAEKYIRRAYAEKPNDGFIMDSYGWLLHKMGRTKEALKLLERAFAQKSGEAIIAEHLADVYLALGLRQKALAVYEVSERLYVANADRERMAKKISNLRMALADDSGSTLKVGSSTGKRQPASE